MKIVDIELSNHYKVVDDFLSKEKFKHLQSTMLGPDFGWFYNPVIDNDEEEEGKFQFTHTFYRYNKPMSGFFNDWYEILFEPIIGDGVLDRIKANLLTKTPEIIENKLHTDIEPPKKPLTTSIFYVNTNNGYTKFKDGTKVESLENRLVTFPVNTKHTGTTCTDENVRVVINLLYMNYE